MTMQSVLDEMTLAVNGRKTTAAGPPTLTPVGTEKGGPLAGRREVAFPHDDSDTTKQAIVEALRAVTVIRQHIAFVIEDLEALGSLYGLSTDGPAPKPADVQQAVERAADMKIAAQAAVGTPSEFDIAFAAKAAAAQAATFAAADADTPAPVAGWTCPNHGDDDIRDLTSKKGRAYRGCGIANCGRFEK